MAGTLDLDGNYKNLYADIIENVVPSCAVLYNMIPFAKKELQAGGNFVQPVILQQEQGWTYAAADASMPALTGNVDMAMKQALVQGAQMAGQSQLTVEAAKRATSKGPSAFEDAVGLQMRVLKESGIKRLEMNFLYGQTSVAIAASSANVNTTTTAITINLAHWAAGFWAGMKGAKFDLYQTGTYGSQTKVNTNGAIIVSTINSTTRVVTITGVAADIAAIDSYIASNQNLAEFYFYGAYGVEAAGLKRQLSNTTGTLFNINAATYDLWRGNQYVMATPFAFTFAQSAKAITAAVNHGLDEEVTVLVCPDSWTNLMTDQAALRQYVNGGPVFENGATKLSFAGQNGKVTIVPHLFVKQGDAFVIPTKNLSRFGATDLTFDIPGTDKGKIFIQLSGALGFEYRCYSHQTIFLDAPAKGTYVSAIVNA